MSNTEDTMWNWDVRVRDRNLRDQKITTKDVETYLAALPDLTDQSEPVELPQPAVEGDEDDEDEA